MPATGRRTDCAWRFLPEAGFSGRLSHKLPVDEPNPVRKRMSLISLEHSKAAYRVDFALYAGAVVTLAAVLLVAAPRERAWGLAGWVLVGLAGWTLIEYLLHRFLLHGLEPFRSWHARHHDRPQALIYAPTVVSAASITASIFAPALYFGDVWAALALTLGVIAGYLAYAVTHHATHHWRSDNAWLRGRKRHHALHHHAVLEPGAYGVTSAFWDHVFRSGTTLRRSGLTAIDYRADGIR